MACAPLEGEYYATDRMSVLNMFVSFKTSQPSGDWIKTMPNYSDGRQSMESLRRHFAGEGNVTWNISESIILNESLHYNNERAISFDIFLTQCQKVFNIYEKEGEGILEEAKVRLLFRKLHHTGLYSSIGALKASQTTGTTISYTMAAKHLYTATSEPPE